MGRIYTSAAQLVGRTPLLELGNIAKGQGIEARILGKLEYFNPAGSVKDRIAKAMIEDAEARGVLKPGSVIIEPTSGNTGVGLAFIAAARGYRLLIVMPETMSVERRQLMKAYGAELVLTPGEKGMKGAIEKANELAAQIPGSFIPGQLKTGQPAIHKATTGPRSGRIRTVGWTSSWRAWARRNHHRSRRVPEVQEPGYKDSGRGAGGVPVLSKGCAGLHKIQGIGAGFVPEVLNTGIYDEVIAVENEDAFAASRLIARSEGVLVGISSGAALWAALQVARRPESKGKTIVVILPDTGERYLSTPLFSE